MKKKNKIEITITKENVSSVREILNGAFSREKPEDIYINYKNEIPYKEMDFFDALLYYHQFANIHLKGFPLCVLPNRDFYIFLEPYSGKFAKKCNQCKEKQNCRGIPAAYLIKFGDGEFKPFREEDYLLINDWAKDKEQLKKFWEKEKENQGKEWEYYFKDIKGKILDAGAGIGAFCDFAPGRIIGIESDPAKVNNIIAKSKKIDLKEGDIANLKFKSGYFDGAHCRFVFEHLSPDLIKKALNGLRRVLKPKGKLFIMAAGKDGAKTWYDVGRQTILNKKILEKLTKEAGFKKYKVFNAMALEKYKGFNFEAEILSKYPKEVALCLIAEK